MEFTNLNFISVLIFFLLIWIIFLLFRKNFSIQKQINKIFSKLWTWSFFYIKNFILFLSILIIFFWIFWVKYWDKIIKNESKWVDVMFVVDVSKSMNVADIDDWNYSYTRLDLVKKSISNFVANHLEDRFWLVIFAWDAVANVPLTTDHDVFLSFLDWVDYRNLVKQWSDFEKAVQLWVERFKSSSKDRSKVMIFVSDWWDEEDNPDYSSIKEIWEWVKWIKFFVAWIWTDKWWKIITWQDFFWRISYQKYKWQYVISAINESNLKNISSALWWEYLKIEDFWDLKKFNKEIWKLEKKVLKQNVNWEKADFWRNLAFISFFFFAIYLILYFFEERIFRKKF